VGRRRDSHRRGAVDLEATRALIEEVLRTAMVLEDIVEGLLEDMPDDAVPGRDPAHVLLAMIVGSSLPATLAAGPRDTRTATALVGAIRERVLTDLHAAASLIEESDRAQNPESTSEKS
jgi:hypothetical protein